MEPQIKPKRKPKPKHVSVATQTEEIQMLLEPQNKPTEYIELTLNLLKNLY